MASSINRRLAASVLTEALDTPLLPDLDVDAEAVVERLLGLALKVDRRRTREHGEVIILTYEVPSDEDVDRDALDGV